MSSANGQSQPTLVGDSSPGTQEQPPSLADQAAYRIQWERAMDHASKFVHYDRGAALLLSWDDTCDELKTKQEVCIAHTKIGCWLTEQVDQLSSVFIDTYGFEVRRAELSHTERPQAQINVHLANFVKEYESRKDDVLLIVYYAGHGWSDLSEFDEPVEPGESARSRKRLRLVA